MADAIWISDAANSSDESLDLRDDGMVIAGAVKVFGSSDCMPVME